MSIRIIHMSVIIIIYHRYTGQIPKVFVDSHDVICEVCGFHTFKTYCSFGAYSNPYLC